MKNDIYLTVSNVKSPLFFISCLSVINIGDWTILSGNKNTDTRKHALVLRRIPSILRLLHKTSVDTF